MSVPQPAAGLDEFEANRSRLRGLAYRMTGSQFEAEDIVQETYLRWRAADQSSILSAKSWLATVATRISLDQLKSARKQREQYVGMWLPEPFLAEDSALDPDASAELDESVSMALLLLMETLSPSERAAYILHDLFRFDFDEVGEILGRNNAAARKLASRARTKISQDDVRSALQPKEHEEVVAAFFEAVHQGELDALVRVLSDKVTMRSDGGGKVSAARKLLRGHGAVTHFILSLVTPSFQEALASGRGRVELHRWFNGSPGLVVWLDDQPATAFNFLVLDDKIAAIHAQRNPDKLAHFLAS